MIAPDPTAVILTNSVLLFPTQEFDTNADAQISYEEFDTALTRWVSEKLTSTAAAGGGGVQGFQQRYEQLMDPRSGGAAAAVLADLPTEDLEQLQVGGY